jgi:hypothetical protein
MECGGWIVPQQLANRTAVSITQRDALLRGAPIIDVPSLSLPKYSKRLVI